MSREGTSQHDANGPEYYYLKTLIPVKRVQVVNSKEAEEIIDNWENAGEKQDDIIVTATSPDIKNKRAAIFRSEFWIYKIEDSSWSKIDWPVGKELMKEEKKSGARKSAESPDGSKVIYAQFVKKVKNRLLFVTFSENYFYRFGIRCKNGAGNKLFRVELSRYPEPCVSWSSDNKFSVVADECNNGSLIYMVYFKN